MLLCIDKISMLTLKTGPVTIASLAILYIAWQAFTMLLIQIIIRLANGTDDFIKWLVNFTMITILWTFLTCWWWKVEEIFWFTRLAAFLCTSFAILLTRLAWCVANKVCRRQALQTNLSHVDIVVINFAIWAVFYGTGYTFICARIQPVARNALRASVIIQTSEALASTT